MQMSDLEQSIINAIKTANKTGKVCAIRRNKSEFMDKYGPYDPRPTVLHINPGMTSDEAICLAKEYRWE